MVVGRDITAITDASFTTGIKGRMHSRKSPVRNIPRSPLCAHQFKIEKHLNELTWDLRFTIGTSVSYQKFENSKPLSSYHSILGKFCIWDMLVACCPTAGMVLAKFHSGFHLSLSLSMYRMSFKVLFELCKRHEKTKMSKHTIIE